MQFNGENHNVFLTIVAKNPFNQTWKVCFGRSCTDGQVLNSFRESSNLPHGALRILHLQNKTQLQKLLSLQETAIMENTHQTFPMKTRHMMTFACSLTPFLHMIPFQSNILHWKDHMTENQQCDLYEQTPPARPTPSIHQSCVSFHFTVQYGAELVCITL